MSIAKMEKLAVIGLDTVKEELISRLMDLGMVEITDQSARLAEEDWAGLGVRDGNEDEVAALDAEINRVDTAIELLEKYSTAKSPLFFTRKAMKKSEFEKIMRDKDRISQNVDYIMGLNERLHSCREIINKRNSELASLTPWVSYDLPLEISETQCTRIDLGVVPSTVDIDGLRKAIGDDSEYVSLHEINRDKDMIYLVIISLKEDQDAVIARLKQWGYSPVPFREFRGTVTENTERITREVAETRGQVAEIEAEITAHDDMRFGMQCLQDRLVMQRDREKVKSRLLKTKRTFNLEGWIPSECRKSVEAVLEEKGCCYEYRDPEENEDVPVLIHNTRFGTPFSAITEMYSLPDYRGFDPTDIFAIFYALFFGLMLSDAGYGLVMTIFCAVVLHKYDLEGMTLKMIRMFLYCGIATVFWGALFGGWFGDFLPTFTQTVFGHKVPLNPIWFNPIEDPTKLLIFSLLFGVVHLFIGMGINAYMLIRRGHLFDAFCDVFAWYMIIAGAGLWLGGGSISAALVAPGKWVCIAGCVIVLLTGGRKKKGAGKVIGGLGALYGITGYISDILSYARLLALGLATGVIANVVNLLGSMLGTGFKGCIAMIIVGVIGHVFNMAINALGSFVHASRLQYIEFFGKFYEDGGEPFDPFRKNTKYVRLVNDTDGGMK